jgi:hypothetical protein
MVGILFVVLVDSSTDGARYLMPGVVLDLWRHTSLPFVRDGSK